MNDIWLFCRFYIISIEIMIFDFLGLLISYNNKKREQFDDNFKLLHSFKVNRCIFNKVNWAYGSMKPVTRRPFSVLFVGGGGHT